MKQAFHRFLRWMFGPSTFTRPSPGELPSYDLEWTDTDAAQLNTFLKNPTGVKLLQKARAMEAAAAIGACKGKSVPARVAGISDTLDWLYSLSIISGASPANDAIASEPENVGNAPEFSYT